MSGNHIPYRALGFDSISAFLYSHPDKFVVQRSGADFMISAVIDKKLNDLARLVQGQKSNKRKKTKAQNRGALFPRPSMYSHQRFSGFQNQPKRQTAKTFNSEIQFIILRTYYKIQSKLFIIIIKKLGYSPPSNNILKPRNPNLDNNNNINMKLAET